MFEALKLSDLAARNCGVLRAPSSTRPALWAAEEDGIRAVVKDYSRNGFLYRHMVGRFLIWREKRAYRRLGGLRGVPTFYRDIDGLALVIEQIPGRSLEDLEKEQPLPGAFFQDLEGLVGDIHRRGLAHCDLKRAPNILLGCDGKPYIVDWSASVSQRELGLYPLTLIYRRFIIDDFNAVTKAQLRQCPEQVSPERKERYYRRSMGERLIRAVRDRLRDLLQRMA
jgi:serine/threonine protein kinase